MRFLPWSLPRVGNGGGKRQFVTPGHRSDPGGNLGKRVQLTRKTRPSESSHVVSGSRSTQLQGDGKDFATLPPKEWGG